MSELFMPHGMCFLWQTDILLLHVLSDGIIAASYFSIPIALLYFVNRRQDLEFKWILPLFAAFIVLCGITHLLGIWVIWNPDYWIDGTAKAMTAVVSATTAVLLWPLMPKLLSIPSPSQLKSTNASLQAEIDSHLHTQRKLEALNVELESRVADRTRALEESNHELERFAYHASHDLRAPLRAINQLSQWVEADLPEQVPDDLREHLDLMRQRVARMDMMLRDLLEYSRMSTLYDARFEETVNGASLVDDVILLAAPPPDMHIEISPKFAAIEVKRMPLQQILLNLIGNAIKHRDTSAGRIDIDVRDDGDSYTFEVGDDGPGIAEEFHVAIFDMFRTLQSRDEVETSGIGLAIVKKAVERFGGSISVDSAPGRGSRFSISWPKA
jgi:signal transduction histidine kinase